MVEHIISESGRTALVIDCRRLLKAATDTQIVGDLAMQTGYWPVFTFVNSLSSLIDLASVGLIGQKSEFAFFFGKQKLTTLKPAWLVPFQAKFNKSSL